MITKEITLCGKPVTLGYCYATEISYKILSGEDILDFGKEIAETIPQKRMPDMHKTILFILASIQSYYESKGEKAPVSDKELMYESAPVDIGLALGTLITLRSEFYKVPADEPKDKPASDGSPVDQKNA